MILQIENTRQKNILTKNIPTEISDENIPSMIVAYAVNIFQFLVNCRWTVSVCISISDYGIFNKVFVSLVNVDRLFLSIKISIIVVFSVNIFRLHYSIDCGISNLVLFKMLD